MYFYPTEYPHFISLLNPRSFLQWYTTVLDACAVVIRVGKMLSMLWCSVNGVCSIRPVVIQMGDLINHTINPTGTEVALAPGLPAHIDLLQVTAGSFSIISPWARTGTAAFSNVFFSSLSSGNQTCVFPKRSQHLVPSLLQWCTWHVRRFPKASTRKLGFKDLYTTQQGLNACSSVSSFV